MTVRTEAIQAPAARRRWCESKGRRSQNEVRRAAGPRPRRTVHLAPILSRSADRQRAPVDAAGRGSGPPQNPCHCRCGARGRPILDLRLPRGKEGLVCPPPVTPGSRCGRHLLGLPGRAWAAPFGLERRERLLGSPSLRPMRCHLVNDFLYPLSKRSGSGLLAANPAALTCLRQRRGYDKVLSRWSCSRARATRRISLRRANGLRSKPRK
jgi:hypothetical protein